MRIFIDILLGIDSFICGFFVGLVIVAVKMAMPHVNEFKQFASMLGIGKKK
jgi:hypothetical protein